MAVKIVMAGVWLVLPPTIIVVANCCDLMSQLSTFAFEKTIIEHLLTEAIGHHRLILNRIYIVKVDTLLNCYKF